MASDANSTDLRVSATPLADRLYTLGGRLSTTHRLLARELLGLSAQVDRLETRYERVRADRDALLALARQYASECANCGGTGLVTRKYEWRGAECDADDQPCPDCQEIRDVIAKATGETA